MSSSHSESPPGQNLVVSVTVLAIISMMRTDPQPRRRKGLSCRHGLRGGPLPEPVAPGYRLCITAEQWRQFPDTPVAVTITGDRTAWGMRVKEIAAIEEIGPR